MLPDSGKEFLQVTNHLIAQAGKERCEEVFLRSAISRAYYAAFNYLSSILRRERLQLSTDGLVHQEIPHCLKNSGDENLYSIGENIDSLKGARTRADYKLDQDIRRTKAEDSLEDAWGIIEGFEEFMRTSNSKDKAEMITGMNATLYNFQQKMKPFQNKPRGTFADLLKSDKN